ncbi:hypothetical protein [Clostridium tagluense]|uniref:Uncharacterized protein n=1 Tax=Clostridium tagluense TaxID=360422 RepID=A0A401UTZ9_9CLOT|nr:hypothetical protein [Clostridium tagluense]GCD12984.1 hypothetical protein Ctaglu_46070 [Clostridium tagluense]
MLTTLDLYKFNVRPSGKEIGGIQNRMTKGTTDITPLELLYAVGRDGCSFKPATFDGNSVKNEKQILRNFI